MSSILAGLKRDNKWHTCIWSGLGIVLVSIVSFVLYKEIPDTPAIIGMGLIITGVVVINVFSKTVSH